MNVKTLRNKLNEYKKIASNSPTYFCEVPLELIEEMLDCLDNKAEPLFDEPPELPLSEIESYMDEINRLKTLRFEQFDLAMAWVRDNATTSFGFSEEDGYIDFALNRLDCAFIKEKDGHWKLSDLVGFYHESKPVFQVWLDK